ncbi:MAG: hypothetical protein ACR2NR_04670 [Solirubrobacteraceae bacterium]
MHSATELRSDSFSITLDGAAASLADVFPRFGEEDRVGVVIGHPCGGVGASGLLLAAVTGFYDAQRARGGDFFIYPDYFLFHVGRPLGDHNMLDVWPSHKEVVVADDAEQILRAVNDRGITRLLVQDGPGSTPAFEGESVASARHRIRSALAYSPWGRVPGADVSVAGNAVTESYVDAVLDSSTVQDGQAGPVDDAGGAVGPGTVARTGADRANLRADRANLTVDGRSVETYRRIDFGHALELLLPEFRAEPETTVAPIARSARLTS